MFVYCGLTTCSAIFQLYTDGTKSFNLKIFTCYRALMPMAARSFSCQAYQDISLDIWRRLWPLYHQRYICSWFACIRNRISNLPFLSHTPHQLRHVRLMVLSTNTMPVSPLVLIWLPWSWHLQFYWQILCLCCRWRWSDCHDHDTYSFIDKRDACVTVGIDLIIDECDACVAVGVDLIAVIMTLTALLTNVMPVSPLALIWLPWSWHLQFYWQMWRLCRRWRRSAVIMTLTALLTNVMRVSPLALIWLPWSWHLPFYWQMWCLCRRWRRSAVIMTLTVLLTNVMPVSPLALIWLPWIMGWQAAVIHTPHPAFPRDRTGIWLYVFNKIWHE